jgi:hypothetical protein
MFPSVSSPRRAGGSSISTFAHKTDAQSLKFPKKNTTPSKLEKVNVRRPKSKVKAIAQKDLKHSHTGEFKENHEMPISARSKRTRLLLKAKLDQGINRGNTISPQESTRNSPNRQLIIHKNTSAPMLKSCVLKVPSLHTVQVPPLRLTSPEAIVRRHASVLEDSPHEPVLQVSPVKLTSPDSIPPQFIDAENSTTPILKGSSRKVHCLPTVRMPPLKLTSPLPILDQGRNGGPFFDSSFPPVVRVPFLPPSLKIV